jgi:hypothetical protein
VRLQTASPVLIIVAAACTTEPPPEPLSEAEAAVLAQAVEDTVETIAEVNTTDLAVTAATYRRIPCTTVDTDRTTFTTVTFDCSFPFEISGTVHFERSSPEQLITITDLLINKTSIDSAKTLVIPRDPKLPRTFDGALVVSGPRRELNSVVSASWVVSGKCLILDAAIFTLKNSVEHSVTITDKRICRRFW